MVLRRYPQAAPVALVVVLAVDKQAHSVVPVPLVVAVVVVVVVRLTAAAADHRCLLRSPARLFQSL